jgi:hypothetical protein
MSDQVNLPGVGPKPRRTVIIAAVAGVALVGLVVVYRKRRAAQNAGLAGGATGAASLDTATGSVGPDGTLYANPAPTFRDTNVDTTGGQVPTNNAQWANAALALMPNWDTAFVQVALGKFLDSQPLTSDEANAVRVAEGLVGPPPQGNLVIIMATTASTPGTGNNTTPTVPTPAPTPAPARGARPTLRQGSSGPSVMELQTLLNAHGAHLVVDGQFGPLTAAAVRSFQASQGIAVDGIVGPITWSKL